jgi:hypothetical protein
MSLPLRKFGQNRLVSSHSWARSLPIPAGQATGVVRILTDRKGGTKANKKE